MASGVGGCRHLRDHLLGRGCLQSSPRGGRLGSGLGDVSRGFEDGRWGNTSFFFFGEDFHSLCVVVLVVGGGELGWSSLSIRCC